MKFPLLDKLDAHTRQIARGTAGTFALQVTGMAIRFLTGLLFARLLGVKGIGIIAYAGAWASILVMFGTFGLQQLLVREVAIYLSREDWGHLRGILRYSRRLVFVSTSLLAAIGAFIAWIVVGDDGDQVTLFTFWIVVIGVPLAGLTQLRQSAVRGLHRIILGQISDGLAIPLILLAIMATLYFGFSASLSPVQAAAIGLAVGLVGFGIGEYLLLRLLPAPVPRARPSIRPRYWLGSAIPMLFISGIELINAQTDILMLGSMVGKEAVGLYSVAARSAALVIFVWGSVNMVLGPLIAKMYDDGEMLRLKVIVHQSAFIIFFFSALVCLGLFLFSEEFLGLYGQAFIGGDIALKILLIGNLVNALAGSVGLILKMTGFERDVLWTGVLAAVANIALNAILIPPYGIAGAATATTISISIWPIAAAIIVYRRTGINATIFGTAGSILDARNASR